MDMGGELRRCPDPKKNFFFLIRAFPLPALELSLTFEESSPRGPEYRSTSDGRTSLTSFGGVSLFPYLTDQIGLERATRNGGLTDRQKERKMKKKRGGD